MRSCQLEGRQIMIEGGICPTTRIMASAAIRTELTVMMIVLFMAGITILRRALEDAIHMAACASHIDMCAGQLEGCQIMVKCDILPTIRIMASAAACAELTIMLIIFFVTSNAVCWSAFE